jgi:ribonuclease HI
MKKYYAVVRGRQPGIYPRWTGENGAQAQVSGYARARYKGFSSLDEAIRWFRDLAGIEPELFGMDPPPQPALLEYKAAPPSSSLSIPAGATLIYTDGASLGNPGPGGYGVVLIRGKERQELSGGYRLTTNNRMELMACIQALQTLKEGSRVVLFSDSRYVINGISKGWARRWRRNGWMRSATQPAENSDLWGELLNLLDRHEVEFHWVRGHAGTPENERCDQLAIQAAQMKNLPVDVGYESQRPRRVSPPTRRTQRE